LAYTLPPIDIAIGPPVEIRLASAATSCMPADAIVAWNTSEESNGIENILQNGAAPWGKVEIW